MVGARYNLNASPDL